MGWQEHLPKRKPAKEIKAIMVRPDAETIALLSRLATEHGVSVNKLVLAIIADATKQEPPHD